MRQGPGHHPALPPRPPSAELALATRGTSEVAVSDLAAANLRDPPLATTDLSALAGARRGSGTG
jgi:hypothetical protein